MTRDERWQFIADLDEELLKGGAMISGWCTVVIREADNAYIEGANLAAIVMAACAVETYLRSEQASASRARLSELITDSGLSYELKRELHQLREYRNRWVHLDDPWDDQDLLDDPEKHDQELEDWAKRAIDALHRTIYAVQFV